MRKALLCLIHQFLLKQCCEPSMVQFANMQICLGEKKYECVKCKGTFENCFQHFWLLYAFLVRMTACTLGIESFCWHQEPKLPQ